MEKITVTLEGATYVYEVEPNEAKVHITLATAFAALGRDISDFDLVFMAQTEIFTKNEGTELAV